MNKGTTSLLIIVLLAALVLPAQAQFGAIIYSGQNSADLYMGKLTDPSYSRVEYWRGGKKLGEITLNGPNGGIITDYGLSKGTAYQYEFRAYRSAGGFLQQPVGNGFVIGGDIQGILTRKDTVSISTDLVDSVYIVPGGKFMVPGYGYVDDVSVPGGEMHVAPGASISFNVTMSGRVAGIRVYDTEDSNFPPGKFSASGGQIKHLEITCHGQASPINGLSLLGTQIIVDSDYPCVLNLCTFDSFREQNQTFKSELRSTNYKAQATLCTIRNESSMIGVQSASQCTVEYDATLWATQIDKCEFRDNGQLNLRPIGTPTTLRHSTFRGGNNPSSCSTNNYTNVEYNVFEPGVNVTVPSDAGFDPSDVKNIHINYNEFQRDNNFPAFISALKVDSIDGTFNYWGQCTGPTAGDRVRFGPVIYDPFLRVKFPATSYWFDIGPDKSSIIANGEDEVVFTGHFYNALAGMDSAGATISYIVRILGDTLMQGTLTTDANGYCTLPIKVPRKYGNAIAMEVYFKSIQCIDKAFIVSVTAPQGADLEVYEASVVQVQPGMSAILPNKPFMVRAVITTTEPVTSKFNVQVRVNNAVYDTFYVYDKNLIGVTYNLESPMTEIALPKAESPTLLFPIDGKSVTPGSFPVVVTIDPPDAQHPKGRIEESNEDNNDFTIPTTAKNTRWGNEGGTPVSVFVQPFEQFPMNDLDSLTMMTDTARQFMESVWPMTSGMVSFTRASDVADYSWINPDTLRQETFEYYLAKAYKMMRLANPTFDRYAFAVDRDWFGTRLHPIDFAHRLSQTLSWSGIYDLMVVSSQSYKFLVHSLGHSFGLRRGDMSTDINDQEEYYNYFVGKEVYDCFDAAQRRVIHYGQNNKIGRLMKAYCFMGNVKLPNESFQFTNWICDVDYQRLLDGFAHFTAQRSSVSKRLAPKAMFIEGSVDSTSGAFSFGPWVSMSNATVSNMVDSAHATHVFRFLDGAGQELSRYYYRPTFVALGLDEGADMPHMAKEYFAFVAATPDGVKKVTVEKDGQVIASRTLSGNPPVVSIDYPTDGAYIPDTSGYFTAKWSATDPDGTTEFFFTVYFSKDNGQTWKLIAFETTNTEAVITASRGDNYKLRVIASDGLLSSEKTITFNVKTGAESPASPDAFSLKQNYPNPFNPSTLITFSLPTPGYCRLDVIDPLGRLVETLVSGYQEAGSHTVRFDAANRPSGTYIAVLRAGENTASIRMTLSK